MRLTRMEAVAAKMREKYAPPVISPQRQADEASITRAVCWIAGCTEAKARRLAAERDYAARLLFTRDSDLVARFPEFAHELSRTGRFRRSKGLR